MANSDLILFFGRFHPLLVHLPIGVIVLLVFLEILGRKPNHRAAVAVSGYLLALAVPASILTALLGWMLSQDEGYDSALIRSHFWTGLLTAMLCSLAALFYKFELKKPYRACLALTLISLVVTSHFGGSLTHGSDYLLRYAPGKTQAASGLGQNPEKSPVALIEDETPAFEAVVLPILDRNCIACHGPEKAKGGLRLDSVESMLRADAPAIVPGSSSDSAMLRRIKLPLNDEDHMPPQGKHQPSEDEVTLLAWWIDSGASVTEPISRIRKTPEVQRILSKEHSNDALLN